MSINLHIWHFEDNKFTLSSKLELSCVNKNSSNVKGGDFLDVFEVEEAKQVKPTEQPKQVKSSKAYDIPKFLVFYGEDRISELKEKIYIITGISPIAQHLYYIDSDDKCHPLSYTIGNRNIDIRQIVNLNRVSDVPVDRNMSSDHDNMHISARDYFVVLNEIPNLKTIHLVNLSDFTSKVNTTDLYQLSLVYHGFVQLYFPMFSMDAFSLWLKDPSSLTNTYPELAPNIKALSKRYEAESTILGKQYNSKIHLQGQQFRISFKSAVVRSVYNEALIQIPELFNTFATSKECPLILTRLYYKFRSMFLYRLNSQEGETAYEHLKYRLQMPETISILIAIKIVRPKFEHRHDYCMLILREHGYIQVRSFWSEEDNIGFDELMKITEQQVNPIIEKINSLSRRVFSSSYQLPLFNQLNSKFSNLTISFVWRQTLSPESFKKLIQALEADFESGIIGPETDEALLNNTEGQWRFRFYKNMVDYDHDDIDLDSYSYLTNLKLRTRWLAAYAQGKACFIINRTTDVKLEVQDLRENEFLWIRKYLEYKLANIDLRVKGTEQLDLRNPLKQLKSRDPALYDFKRYGTDVVYSRICQKDHQPIPVDQHELSKLPESKRKLAIKYINHTTGLPLWYYCPNPKNPFVSFITGQHPKGYCIPCCKKTDPDADQKKRNTQHKVCMDTGIFSEQVDETSNSRYILNYGKPIDLGRLSQLPDIFLRYLLYNSQVLSNGNIKNINNANYFLYGVQQNSATMSDIGSIYSIADALGMEVGMMIEDICKYLAANPRVFRNILGSSLQHYFVNLGKLLSVLRDEFITNKISIDVVRFSQWNELIISLVEEVFGIIVLVLEDLAGEVSGTSQRNNRIEGMDLILPKPISRSEELFSDKKIIILFRRARKTQKLYSSNYSYYPVYMVIPQMYFKNFTIQQKIYASTDDLANLMKQLVSGQVKDSSGNYGLEVFDEMGVQIIQKYLNSRGQIYCVEINLNGTKMLWPVPMQYPTDTSHTTELARRSKATVKLESVLDFAIKWNKLDSAPQLKVRKWLCLSKKDPVLCGVMLRDMYVWCAPMTAKLPELRKYLAKLHKKYESLWDDEADTIYWFTHDPDTINLALQSAGETQLPDPGGLRQKTLDKISGYESFLRKVMQNLDKDRNEKRRKELKTEITNNTISNKTLSDDDISRLTQRDYKIEDIIFDFDHVRLREIEKLGSREEVKKYLQKHINVKPAETVYWDLLAADFSNPVKREYLQRSMIFNSDTDRGGRSNFRLNRFPMEEVYVKLI